MRKLLVVAMLLASSGVAWGQLPPPKSMPYGAKTIDGDLSDWTGADWLTLGAGNPDGGITYGSATDLTNARYSCTWSETGLYVAVQLTDTVPVYEAVPPSNWDSADFIAVYIDSANTNYVNYAYGGSTGPGLVHAFADAQHYIISPDPCGPVGSTWSVVGWWYYSPADVGVIAPTVALAIDGDRLMYEIYCPAQQPVGTPLPLLPGMMIGLDLAALSNDGMTYSWHQANSVGNKWNDAASLQDWVLIPEPVTLALLSLGGLSLIRRKK